jgi:hypothetical protein
VLLSETATAEPPVGAGALKVTVQALVPGPVNEAGLQVRLLTVTVTSGGARLMEAVLELPFSAAVMTAV